MFMIPCCCRCAFQGTNEEVKEHLKSCEYEGVKVSSQSWMSPPGINNLTLSASSWCAFQGILAEMEGQIKSLQQQLDSRESVVAELVEKIGSLEASKQTSTLRIGMVSYPSLF